MNPPQKDGGKETKMKEDEEEERERRRQSEKRGPRGRTNHGDKARFSVYAASNTGAKSAPSSHRRRWSRRFRQTPSSMLLIYRELLIYRSAAANASRAETTRANKPVAPAGDVFTVSIRSKK